MNYFNFDNITLARWVSACQGDLSVINDRGVVDSTTFDEWYKMQDDYIALFGGDSPEIKQYKRLCFDYYNALFKWCQNPKLIGKNYTEVNVLYAEKVAMQEKIFSKDKVGIEQLIARVTIAVKFRIDKEVMTAKEFFLITKELQEDGNKTD